MSEWQPIETAPKDGTKVDLWCVEKREKYAPRRLTERRYGPMTNWVGEEIVGWNVGDPYRDWQPTHWMPLPAPPTTKGPARHQFTDGSVALRWRTAKRSTSFWASMEDMLAIHGHPEYGSELVWHEEYLVEQNERGYDPHGPEVTALHYWFADNGQQWKWHDDGCRSEQARALLNHLAKAGFILVPSPPAQNPGGHKI